MNNKYFDSEGYFIGKIPNNVIVVCSFVGDVSWAVESCQQEIDFNCPQKLAREYLKEFGAWDDLDTVSDTIINQRVLWIACNELKENDEWLGLVH